MPAPRIPRTHDELDAGWLTHALAAGGVIERARVTAITVEPVGEERAFAGHPVRVRLIYDRSEQGAPVTLIAKFPATNAQMRGALSGLRWYESELRFYDELAGDTPVRTPRSYFSAMDAPAQDYVLLIEDLGAATAGDQIAGASLQQAEIAIDELARLHARWWEHPRLDTLDWLARGAVRRAEAADFWQQFYRRGWEHVRGAMGDMLPDAVTPIAEALGDRYAALVRESAEPPRTLVHGDYRLDNLLFDAQPRPAVIDWQLVSRGRGVYDLAYFLGTNLAPELRRTHEHALLRRWHDVAAARDRSYDLERCLHDYRRSMLLVFGFWVQTAGAATFPEAAYPLRDAALTRASAALVELDAAELLD